MTLRILHTEASCGWGGQELRVLSEAEGLRGRGHEVWLAAPAQSRIYAEAMKREMPVVALPIERKNLAGLFSLRAFIGDHRIQVVNTHSSTDSWLTALACIGLTGAPPVVRTRHISAPIASGPLSRWLYGRASAHVVTTGEALRAQVIEQAGVDATRVTSVPTGVDLERFAPGDPNEARTGLNLAADAFTVAIVATLRSWKGHAYLVDAVAAAAGVRLLIVGDGPGRENLERQVTEAALRDRVVFTGHQDDVVPWMRAADVVALPSYANEGIPQALMQAMACGRPVITTNVGAIGEIVRDGIEGLVVAPRDVAALTAAIEHLRADPALRSRLGAAALEQARLRFSRQRMLDAMETIFTAVVNQRASGPASALSPR